MQDDIEGMIVGKGKDVKLPQMRVFVVRKLDPKTGDASETRVSAHACACYEGAGRLVRFITYAFNPLSNQVEATNPRAFFNVDDLEEDTTMATDPSLRAN